MDVSEADNAVATRCVYSTAGEGATLSLSLSLRLSVSLSFPHSPDARSFPCSLIARVCVVGDFAMKDWLPVVRPNRNILERLARPCRATKPKCPVALYKLRFTVLGQSKATAGGPLQFPSDPVIYARRSASTRIVGSNLSKLKPASLQCQWSRSL